MRGGRRQIQPSALLLQVPQELNERLFAVCRAYADMTEALTGRRSAPQPAILARYLLERALAGAPARVARSIFVELDPAAAAAVGGGTSR